MSEHLCNAVVDDDDDALVKALKPPIGELAKRLFDVELPVVVMRSREGFYFLGTAIADLRVTQEALETWPSQATAEMALLHGCWTQKTEA